jgi:hypothetical protein
VNSPLSPSEVNRSEVAPGVWPAVSSATSPGSTSASPSKSSTWSSTGANRMAGASISGVQYWASTSLKANVGDVW